MKIAVVSKNKEFSRFFEIEALSFGAEAVCYERLCDDSPELSLIIVDADTVKQGASVSANKMLIISSDGTQNERFKGMRFSTYPMSVEELRSIFEEIKYGEYTATAQDKKIDQSTDRIYFYKNSPLTVRYGELIISLSENEARLLECLCQNAYKTVERAELQQLLGAEQGNITDVYICKLRKKLEAQSKKRLIYSVRSVGYKIMADMEWE